MYINLFNDRFSRHAGMYATTEDRITAIGGVGIPIAPSVKMPVTLGSETDISLLLKGFRVIYESVSRDKSTTRSYRPRINGGVKLETLTMI